MSIKTHSLCSSKKGKQYGDGNVVKVLECVFTFAQMKEKNQPWNIQAMPQKEFSEK